MENEAQNRKETEIGENKTGRREILRKAGLGAYVAPTLIMLAVSRKVQVGSVHNPPGPPTG